MVTNLHPCLTAKILLVDAGSYAQPRLWRVVEHRSPNAFYSGGGYSLPVVGAAGGPLHQVHLFKVLAIGKRAVSYKEVEVRAGRVTCSGAVLEIDASYAGHIAESVVGNAAQVGVVLEIACQVIQNIDLAAGRKVIGINAGSGDVSFLGIHVPAIRIKIPSIVTWLVYGGVEIPRVVVLSDVCVLDTLICIDIVFLRCAPGNVDVLVISSVSGPCT